ncbi:RNA polymerase sigma factor [Planctomycetota bacterium]
MVETTIQSTATDIELIEATRQGDLAAFGMLTQRYWSLAVALGLSRLDNTADAEDVAQESFIKAHAKLATLHDPQRFTGWLSRIVLQQCVDVHRKKQRQQRALGHAIPMETNLEYMPAFSTNPGLTKQQIRFIRQTIGNLPEKFKQPIIMRFVSGLSAVEIAQQLGKRPGTVRIWLHRAYQILRQELAPLLEEV